MAVPAWQFIRTEEFSVGDGDPVTQQTAITAPTGGTTVDAEARTAINAIITALEAYGLVADN